MREQIILDEEQMYLHHEQMILKSEQNIRPCGVDPQNLAEEQGGVAAAVDSGVPEEDHARQGVGGRGALNWPLRLPRPIFSSRPPFSSQSQHKSLSDEFSPKCPARSKSLWVYQWGDPIYSQDNNQ